LTENRLPAWAQEEVRLSSEETLGEWNADDPFHETPKRFSRVVSIAYPNQVHYAVQKLVPGEGWVYTEPWNQITMYWSQELAEAAAQKKAYYTQQPHRVLEVVWRG
jgi:hypothetical protein